MGASREVRAEEAVSESICESICVCVCLILYCIARFNVTRETGRVDSIPRISWQTILTPLPASYQSCIALPLTLVHVRIQSTSALSRRRPLLVQPSTHSLHSPSSIFPMHLRITLTLCR